MDGNKYGHVGVIVGPPVSACCSSSTVATEVRGDPESGLREILKQTCISCGKDCELKMSVQEGNIV